MSDGITCRKCNGRLSESDYQISRTIQKKLGKPTFTPPKVCNACVLLALMTMGDDETEVTW